MSAAAVLPVGVRPRLGRSLGVAGWVPLAILLVVALLALLAPLLPLPDPLVGDIATRLRPVGTPGHPLGTDGLGRDILSRMVWGGRSSLVAGIVPVVIGGILGGLLGLVAGIVHPIVGGIIMRILDVLFAFPALLLAIVVAASFQPGLATVMIAVTIVIIPPVARIAETETVRIRARDYLVVARVSGVPLRTVVLRQMVPHLAPSLLVYCTTLVGLSIIYTAGLSFLGLGVAPPTPDWGSMINETRQFVYNAPVTAVLPTIPIIVVSIAFSVLGNALRDTFAVEGGGR